MQTQVQTPAANPDEGKHNLLRKVAIVQMITGSIVVLLGICWAAVYGHRGYLGLQCQDGIFIILNASLIICCGHPASMCRLKAHLVIAIFLLIDELTVSLVMILYLVSIGRASRIASIWGMSNATPSSLYVLPSFCVIFSITNIILLLTSAVLSGQLGCCNSNRNDQPPQIIYVQQAAPAQQVAVQPGQMMVQQPAQPMMVQQPPQQGGYYVQPTAANQVPNQPMEDKPQCPPAYAQINEKDNDAQKLLLSEQKQ